MSESKSRKAITLAAVLGGFLLGHLVGGGESVHAGGPERINSIAGPVFIAWPNTNLSVSVVTDAAGSVLPGYPPANAFAPVVGPGMRAIEAAAATWTNAVVPVSTAPASNLTISIVQTPIVNSSMPTAPTVVSGDGVQMVSAWAPAVLFTAFGGPATWDVVPTLMSVSMPGVILDADILLNTRTKTPAFAAAFPILKPIKHAFSFIERIVIPVSVLGLTQVPTDFASTTLAPLGTDFPDPSESYLDLQGELTHAFGHFLGLAHSLLDGDMGDIPGGETPNVGGSLTPTMFPRLVPMDFPGVDIFGNTNPPGSSPTLKWFVNGQGFVGEGDPTATATEGIAGTAAQSLEADDIGALIFSYPTTTPATGTISGIVAKTSGPVVGAHVVAVRRSSAGEPMASRRIRVSTLSIEGGNYSIKGLPPGDYAVFAEPIDATTWPVEEDENGNPIVLPPYESDGYFSLLSDLPYYVAYPYIVAKPVPFMPEYHNMIPGSAPADDPLTESFGELRPLRSSNVAVANGGESTANFLVDPPNYLSSHTVPPMLKIGKSKLLAIPGGLNYVKTSKHSMRGVIVTPKGFYGDTYPDLRLSLRAPKSQGNASTQWTPYVFLGLKHATSIQFNQMLALDPIVTGAGGPTAIPPLVFPTMSAGQSVTTSFISLAAFGSDLAHTYILMQAIFVDQAAAIVPIFSNTVNIWFANR